MRFRKALEGDVYGLLMANVSVVVRYLLQVTKEEQSTERPAFQPARPRHAMRARITIATALF
ncbi:hypothetical protein JYU34_007706 [Plutella xylostella]|uniref:Uncharacterized protein n=1 Tax=Plutella xylostella TaxID=51655 RepID=A0ABQ7QR89_PLUXY|nr:hypothetical protein JYU34_007706 [Plutella xylostella]